MVLFSYYMLIFPFSAYKSGMSCIDYLRKECPQDQQEQINVALVNLRDAQAELSELCENDKLYEGNIKY